MTEKTETMERKVVSSEQPQGALRIEEKKAEKVEKKVEVKKEVKKELKQEVRKEEKKEEKHEPKKEVKQEVKIVKKDEAITKGNNLHASMKQCKYICKFIKNKPIDDAIKDLEDVILLKKVVPFKGEIPHRKGRVMSGRYPINASKIFVTMLKTLKGNVLTNKMDLDKTRIYFGSANYASRPSKKRGGRFKRTNIVLKAKEVAE